MIERRGHDVPRDGASVLELVASDRLREDLEERLARDRADLEAALGPVVPESAALPAGDGEAGDLAVAELAEQRGAQRGPAGLARHLVEVVARARAERRAATLPVRRLLGAHAGAAGVLLLPELLVRAGDLTTRLGLGGALTGVRLVHHDRVLQRAAENPLAERGGIDLSLAHRAV